MEGSSSGPTASGIKNRLHDISVCVNRNSRRSSLPTPQLSSLHRTTSHKNLPHLAFVDRVKSMPFHFSPKCSQENKHLHSSHSHCTLPHLPAGTTRQRASLPDKVIVSVTPISKTRRKSFPLEAVEEREQDLHRCKANHKTNITFAEIASELRNISKERRNQSVKEVKSEPTIFPLQTREEIPLDFLKRHSSKSFHYDNSSVVLVHHIDSACSQLAAGSCDSSHKTHSLARIREDLVS